MMKKNLLLIFTLLIILHGLKSQEINSEVVYPKTVIRLHLIVPGVLVEQKIKENFTIVFDGGTTFNLQLTQKKDVIKSNMYLSPYVSIEPRIYTNLEKRKSSGKRTDYYSGQYFGFQAKYGFATNHKHSMNSFGALWGFQRTLWTKGYWNISLGLGFTTYNGIGSLGTIGDFGIGFILF